MEFALTHLGILKLVVIFSVILLGLKFKLALWLCILSGSITTIVLCGISPVTSLITAANVLNSSSFLLLAIMLFLILSLSNVQRATGQSERLVICLEHIIRWPRFRLVLFPALVGLLPMPGGALFSCPMLAESAKNTPITEQHKTLINYWFRHIWELAWPLYPGYILASSLLHLPLSRLMLFTFPLVLSAYCIGWLFFMRSVPLPEKNSPNKNSQGLQNARKEAVYESIPLLVTFGGAGVIAILFNIFLPNLPSQLPFIVSLSLAITTAYFQGKKYLKEPLGKLLCNWSVGKLLLLIYAIFLFKDTIGISGLIADIAQTGQNTEILALLFAALIIPFLCGIITGIMVGFVGTAFPILLGMIEYMHLESYTLPIVLLALMAGNCGQLLSPVHVCLIVSCDFFKVKIGAILKKMLLPTMGIFMVACCWAYVLYALDLKL